VTCSLTEPALAKAHKFLLRAQPPALEGEPLQTRQAALWQDFRVFDTPSDEWVPAYVAAALAETGESALATEAARHWWRALVSRDVPALGYRAGSARDADSTLWACRLAHLLGEQQHPAYARFVAFLRGCIRPDGGLATFPSARALAAQFPSQPRIRQGHGWTCSHVCVTAAALWLPEIAAIPDVTRFLVRAQTPEGYWNPYWWADREYATALAIESLARQQPDHADDGAQQAIAKGAQWLSGFPPGASAFRLALRVSGLAQARLSAFIPPLNELMELQLDDGSWPASARMRIPPLDSDHPDRRWNWDEHGTSFASIVLDQERIFTTATAVRALTACSKM